MFCFSCNTRNIFAFESGVLALSILSSSAGTLRQTDILVNKVTHIKLWSIFMTQYACGEPLARKGSDGNFTKGVSS